MAHLRSWDTETPVGQSKREFEELVRRYGATGFTVSEDYASRTVVVAFSIQVEGGELADIRLPVGYDTVKRKLMKVQPFVSKARRRSDTWINEQAARVAWRHLLLWAEASLSAVDAGLYSLQEAFFAHTMIATPGGGLIGALDAVNMAKRIASRSESP
jgi:hypothetical protein